MSTPAFTSAAVIAGHAATVVTQKTRVTPRSTVFTPVMAYFSCSAGAATDADCLAGDFFTGGFSGSGSDSDSDSDSASSGSAGSPIDIDQGVNGDGSALGGTKPSIWDGIR